MQPREFHALVDILIASRLALNYISGKIWTEFVADIQLQDSVVRRIEIIGEAFKRLSEETHSSLSQIPWRRMIGMRNRIIHEYDKLDLAVVWNVLHNELPPLIVELEKIVPPEDAE